eukprot:CAMPEP_0194096528 /NCGR_PEP_ID=MMETSP0149-20130528/57387_1 /TAXON_ID=122233 /ORGANISM="Chaetoceros debilis, Strain MM31A-1" /LENGTH=1231 /DNA_ID=CAMNT_0038782503 /DNA_START=194 /DNA_END=3889 /DNA_ORIENTATION=-
MDNSILRHPPLPSLPIHHLSNNNNGDTKTNINLPLCLIQVSPIVDNHEHIQDHLNLLSSPLVKLELAALCRNQGRKDDNEEEDDRPWIVWDNNDNDEEDEEQQEQDVSGTVKVTVPVQMKRGTMCQNHTHSLHIWNKQRRRNDNRQTATATATDMDAEGKDTYMNMNASASAGKVILPIITLQSQDPIQPNGIPCFIRVYSIPHCCPCTSMNVDIDDVKDGRGDGGDWTPSPSPAQILEGTLIQILPTLLAIPIQIPIQIKLSMSMSMSMSRDENGKEDKTLDSQAMVTVTMYEANAISKSKVDDYFNYSRIHIQRVPSLHRDIMGQTSLYDQFLNHHLHNHHHHHHSTFEEMHQMIHQHDEEILRSFEEDTVQAVTIRMKMLLGLDGGNGNSNCNDNDTDGNEGHGIIRVGTTPNAISTWDEQYKRRTRMKSMLRRRRSGVKSISSSSPRSNTNNEKKDMDLNIGLSFGGALTVHNPHHGSGKTLLVSTLARHVLHCHHVHTINAATLFAKYGASGTDAALECMLHSIVMKAAAHSMSGGRHGGVGTGTGADSRTRASNSPVGSVCIILDHLETFLPPAMSGGRGIGDPAIPALNAMAAYLSKVVHCIQVKKYFPYPTINNNPLYNIHIRGKSSSSSADAGGYVLPIRVCLVGIVTCDDDGGRRASGGYNMNMGMGTVLDALGENRYRIPSPSIKGQCEIFTTMALAMGAHVSVNSSASIESYSSVSRTTCIMLSEDARRELPTIIAKMKPKIVIFRAVLSKLEQIVSQKKMQTKIKTTVTTGSKSDRVNGQANEQKKVSSLSVALPLPLSLEADADDVREAFVMIHAVSAGKIVSNNLMMSTIASKSNSNSNSKASKRNEAGSGQDPCPGHNIDINEEKKSSAIKRNDYFSSIGGNSEAKKSLEDALAFDEGKRLLLKKFGLSPPCGVLMFGPPGTGKTLLARATAEMMQADANSIGMELSDSGPDSVSGGMFISLSASTIVRSEVGQSEKLVTSSFEMAAKNAPSVIFIDEFQALFTSRDGKGSNRLSSTLLQCMDDISKWRDADETIINNSNSTSQTSEEDQDNDDAIENNGKSSRVVVLAATNTPWMIDRAFLRNGRFDRVVHVDLPTLEERKSILRVYVCQMKLEQDTDTSIDSICQAVAEKCIGFSGADLEALVRSAAVRCLHESSKKSSSSISLPSSSASGESFGVGVGVGVGLRHFIDAKDIDMPNPSSNKALVERLRTWRP